MRRGAVALTVALLIATAAPAPAQLYAPETLDRNFRVEWETTRDRKGPAVEGYLYNTSMQTAYRVRLGIARLDGAGNVVGNSAIWVPGDVQRGDRAYFKASVPDAAGYRVQVLSFDWACEGGAGGM